MVKPLLTARYRVVVRDKNGKIKYIEEAPSKSFILNFLYVWWLCFNLNTSDSVSTTNSSGSETSMTTTQPMGWYNWVNGGAKPYSGIQVGSGTSSPSASSPYLESLISSGTGSGQLSYGSDSVTSPSTSSDPGEITITKTFTNSSGGSVTVGEIGLAPQIRNDSTSTYEAALMVHDVLSSAVSVPNGGSITITYTLQVNT